MTGEDNRFESDHEQALPDEHALPEGWAPGPVDGASASDVDQLLALVRRHEEFARGWPSASRVDVLKEVSVRSTRTRESVVVRDPEGVIRAWGRVHDRAAGRMVLLLVVSPDLDDRAADASARLLLAWAETQAQEVGVARGHDPQQVDTGTFSGDERQQRWLARAGFRRVRTWWQMSRPVTPDEADLVPSPTRWEADGVVYRQVEREGGGMPEEQDLRTVHRVLEGAFTDHFNFKPETFGEFLARLREEPGHRWDHWWLAELTDAAGEPAAVGALAGSVSETDDGPEGSYVDYIGVLSEARGRGVAKGLLRTIIADAAARGRDRVGLEVDADSPSGAERIYTAMGWRTTYETESWHKDARVGREPA